MKKVFFLLGVSLLLVSFPMSPVLAGVVERSDALEALGDAEITAYVGNNGYVGMENAGHPSILFRLLDAKPKNDNSLTGKTYELITEIDILQQGIVLLAENDNDFELIQSESM
jgi:hypothetical protein